MPTPFLPFFDLVIACCSTCCAHSQPTSQSIAVAVFVKSNLVAAASALCLCPSLQEMAAAHAPEKVHEHVQQVQAAPGSSQAASFPTTHSTSSRQAQCAPAQQALVPAQAHTKPRREGSSPAKSSLPSTGRMAVPQVALPSQQPASPQVPSTAFQLFCSDRQVLLTLAVSTGVHDN